MSITEQERPKYSICMCNYNMADTIMPSLTSILQQLDHRYEVIVVDDGSTDDSLKVLNEVQQRYAALKIVSLPRSKSRKLGLTRNKSVEAASGQYVLLHLDCDDTYGPNIQDFVEVYHQLEVALGHDILVSGQHINMGRRDFLLRYGPYRNLLRGEDRDLWLRLAAIGSYVPLVHTDFVTRLPKADTARISRSIIFTFDHLVNDFRYRLGLKKFFYYELRKWPKMSLQQKLFRTLCFVPAYLWSLTKTSLGPVKGMETWDMFADYRSKYQGTFSDILARYEIIPNWENITPSGQHIFLRDQDDLTTPAIVR
jgi:glycosyltransferase involved in cell wall biosynthesis